MIFATAAQSFLLMAGTDVKTVQERLGHSNASMTINTYSHALEGSQSAGGGKAKRHSPGCHKRRTNGVNNCPKSFDRLQLGYSLGFFRAVGLKCRQRKVLSAKP